MQALLLLVLLSEPQLKTYELELICPNGTVHQREVFQAYNRVVPGRLKDGGSYIRVNGKDIYGPAGWLIEIRRLK